MNAFTVKWGILATGGIAETFSRDLLLDPSVRGVSDVAHSIVAVASSTSKERAEQFMGKLELTGATAYGSYEDLLVDPGVQIVYIATPHSQHFQTAMLALAAGKHVLCEKPLTVTAAQTRKLSLKAREKGLFLMEAMWTRFLPVVAEVQALCSKGEVGHIYRVIADVSCNFDGSDGNLSCDDSHRAVNPALAGGALLDLGVYALSWLLLILHDAKEEAGKDTSNPVQVVSAVQKYDRTGVDESSAVILHFPSRNAMGIALSSWRMETGVDENHRGGPSVTIQGSKGEIHLIGPAYLPRGYRIIRSDGTMHSKEAVDPYNKDGRGSSARGMFWEADECARCLRDCQVESSTCSLTETTMMMEIVDQVLANGGVRYPDEITRTCAGRSVFPNQGSVATDNGRKSGP